MFSDPIEKLNRFHLATVDQVCNCFNSGVSLFLKVEGALKKVGGRASSADCYGGCPGQWRSQPDSLVPLCKFHIVTIIYFFRN